MMQPVVRRLARLVDLLVIALAALVTGCVVYFLSTYPVAYQKAMAVAPTPAAEPDWSRGYDLDVQSFIARIPYRDSNLIDVVRPSEVYETCIVKGHGNCANKSRGLSWHLSNEGIPFQRVDFLPVNGFLRGMGHTVIRTRFQLDGQHRIGMVDLLDGGLPTFRGEPMDLVQLRQVPPFAADFIVFSPRIDDRSDYYGSFLESVVYGVAEDREIVPYLRYLERWHFSIGNAKYERMLLASSAIVFGFFPKSHVSPEDYARLYASSPWTFRIAYTLTWSARALLIAFPCAIILRAGTRMINARSRVSDSLEVARASSTSR